ncbi:hypothetical protein ABL840_29680 [Variovorax sp. NFACC27]|uniref:hypothetical protein n=1 Tax=unclassified Variovorax TaxID=663243 RepID=UPI00115FF8A1
MSNQETEWNGSKLFVTSTLLARKLWQAASIDLFLGEKCLLKTGGVFKLVGTHSVEFEHEGTRHRATLSWGRAGFRSFPIKVEIDGAPLLEGHVVSSNWLLSFWPWLVVGGLISHWAWRQ